MSAVVRARLLALEQAALDAEALARAAGHALATAQQKIPGMQNRVDSSSTMEDMRAGEQEVQALGQRVAALEAAAAARQHRAGALRQAYVKCATFLRRLPTAPTEEAPVRLVAAGDPVAEVNRLRGTIASLRQQLVAVRNAPPTAAELREAVAAKVDEMATRGTPTVTAQQGALSVYFGKVQHIPCVSHKPADPIDVLAWLNPDQMIARLQAQLAADPRALPAAERPRRIAELEQQIEAAEREEEAWIASGADVERRPDASPAVILGVRAA